MTTRPTGPDIPLLVALAAAGSVKATTLALVLLEADLANREGAIAPVPQSQK